LPDTPLIAYVTAMTVAAVSYAATNLDNLLLLATVGSDAARRRAVVAGFLVATAIVFGLSVAGTLLANVLAPKFLGYLGIVPILLGLRLAIAGPPPAERTEARMEAVPVAALLVGNSGDTIAAFAPLFAESARAMRIAVATGFVLCAAAWLFLLLRLSGHAEVAFRSSPTARRRAHQLAAATMIAVGSYILWDSSTDTL